jgi:hypothetical protein
MRHLWPAHGTGRLTLEQRLALKFTWLVCGLILISGTVFATGDVLIANYRMMRGLNDQIDRILSGGQVTTDLLDAGQSLPYNVRPFTRIIAPDGTVLYKGDLFAGASPGPVDPFGATRPTDNPTRSRPGRSGGMGGSSAICNLQAVRARGYGMSG